MKYTIETTEYGCVENLELSNGEKFTRRHERTDSGCKSPDDEFGTQLEEKGFSEEITEVAYDIFDGFFALDFLELAELSQ